MHPRTDRLEIQPDVNNAVINSISEASDAQPGSLWQNVQNQKSKCP